LSIWLLNEREFCGACESEFRSHTIQAIHQLWFLGVAPLVGAALEGGIYLMRSEAGTPK